MRIKSGLREENQRRLDEMFFESLAGRTVCDIEHLVKKDPIFKKSALLERKIPVPGEQVIRRYPQVDGFINANSDFASVLPAHSDAYLKDILKIGIYANEESIKDLSLLILNTAATLENGHAISKDHAFDATFWYPNLDEMIKMAKRITDLKQGSRQVIPISLSLNSTGSVWHATSLLAVRDGSETDFVFMDPLNWKFSEIQTYSDAIFSLKRLIDDPEHLNRSIIRWGYFWSKKLIDGSADLSKRDRASNFYKAHRGYERLGLLDDDFYKKFYQKPFCELIRRNFAEAEVVEVTLNFEGRGGKTKKIDDARSDLLVNFAAVNR